MSPRALVLRLLFIISFSGLLFCCVKTSAPSGNNNPPPNPQDVKPEPTAVGTPVGTLVSQTIGPNGGSIVSDDGVAEVIIPANALSANTTIGIQSITNNCPGGTPNAYRFTPNGLHFDQNVTVKFHYTDQLLKSTLADLMGIAYQDSTGAWWRFKEVSNDSINKVISASTNHFTDYTQFLFMQITPSYAVRQTNKTLDLLVTLVYADDDELVPLPGTVDPQPSVVPVIVYKNGKCNWSINGGIAGDYGSFITDNGRLAITYKAPGSVPSSNNPVAISANIDMGGMKYMGKKFNKTVLVSSVKIGSFSYDVDVDVTIIKASEVYNDTYNDGASFEVDVDEHNLISIPIAVNREPTVTPPSGHNATTTATWIPDKTGITNITGGFGVFANDTLGILLTNDGAVTPSWHIHDEILGDYDDNGESIQGFPGALSFPARDTVQHLYFTNGTAAIRGTLSMTITITPK